MSGQPPVPTPPTTTTATAPQPPAGSHSAFPATPSSTPVNPVYSKVKPTSNSIVDQATNIVAAEDLTEKMKKMGQ